MREKLRRFLKLGRKILRKFLRFLRGGKNTKRENELVKKFRQENWVEASRLLNEGTDPDSLFYHKTLGLYDLFSHQESAYAFSLLLPYEPDVNLRDRKKQLLFEVAINMRNMGMFDDLLKCKAKNKLVCSTGKSLVHFAAEHVYVSADGKYLAIEFVRKLLEKGIIWQKSDFPSIDDHRVQEILKDEINGLEELSKYLVDLSQK